MINRMYVIILLSVLPLTACGSAQGGEKTEAPEVYFIREITPRNMVRIYEAQERPATGKVAVKLSTGEPDGHNYLKPELIKEIVTKVGGTIVECNTAYGGGRAHTEAHLKAAADHGFTAIAPVDIMDADGEVSLPVKGGRHLKENFVGSHYPLSVLPLTACGSAQGGEKTEAPEVYFIREITPRNMVRIYEAQERPATGKVAVKLSTGEPDGHNYLKPELIKEIVTKVGGTIVECNTAYGGGRAHTEAHLKAAADHGFTAIAPVDIMDADGEVSLPVKGGRHLKENFVGSHYPRYDFTVVLSHFKGHAMGGFGGAVKNISIGIASSAGKAWIHSAGKTKNAAEMWSDLPAQDDFLESMAESAKSVADHCGDRILYISVMNNLSVDCDCDAHPEEPKMGDIGILASLDPVALDKACVDMVYASPDPGKSHLIERMESRHGIHTLEHAEAIGLGSQQYRLVELK